MFQKILLDTATNIPDRPATWSEALELMGIGWGGIFIVIIIIMLVVLVLNSVSGKKSDK